MPQLTYVDNFAQALMTTHLIGTHTIKAALSNVAIASSVTALSGVTEISATNGYTAGGLTISASTTAPATDVGRLIFADSPLLTASGGSIGPFRYVYIYNDTVAGDPGIAILDLGSPLTLPDGSSWGIDFQGLYAFEIDIA